MKRLGALLASLLLAGSLERIYQLEAELSRTREDSAVSRLNSAAGGTPVDVWGRSFAT